jgi:ATP-binding cassette subfamily D (ALD) protein 4
MAIELTFRNITKVFQICWSGNNVKQNNWMLPCSLISIAILLEVCSIMIMGVISNFYEAVLLQDVKLFASCLWRSICVVTLISSILTLKMYLVNLCALQWRHNLVMYLQQLYMKDKVAYDIINNYKLENPDQRITQDADKLTAELAQFLGKVVAAPFIIIIYTLYLWNLFNYIAPLACFIYYLICSLLSYLQARKVVFQVYLQEALEGTFRYRHMCIRENIESITLLHGEGFELNRLENIFNELIAKIRHIIRLHTPLYLIVNWFSYMGAIGKKHNLVH